MSFIIRNRLLCILLSIFSLYPSLNYDAQNIMRIDFTDGVKVMDIVTMFAVGNTKEPIGDSP